MRHRRNEQHHIDNYELWRNTQVAEEANMFDFLNGISEMTEAKIMGVLITKVDERKNYYKQTREILAGYDNINVFETFIHVDTSVEWAQDNSVPVSVYKKSTRSAKEFQQLAREVMDYGSR